MIFRYLFFSVFFLLSVVNSFSQSDEKLQFKWDSIAHLQDPNGINGAFIGIHNNVLLIAGGTNFPKSPVWEGGEKVWYNSIQVLKRNGTDFFWAESIKTTLPMPLGNGASVSTPQGVFAIGGNNAQGTYNKVYLLKWDPASQKVIVEEQPPLPVPLANMEAAIIGEVIYVVGGQERKGGVSKNHFFSYKLGAKEWTKLPDLPGKGRIQPIVVSQNNGEINAVYVFSGTHFNPDAQNTNEFLSDVYEYNPFSKTWVEKSPIPSNNTPGMEGGYIGAAPALPLGDAHIIIFGGAGGKEQLWAERSALKNKIAEVESSELSEIEAKAKIALLEEKIAENIQNTSFSNTIWAYHTITDTWSERGNIPGAGQVVTRAIRWGEDIIIPAGEIRPGVRTSAIRMADVIPRKASFGWINYLTLIAYLALMLGIGFYFSGKNKNTNDFFLAGGRIPWWAAGLSIYATMLSAITYLSQPALSYAFDWQAYLGYFTILLTVPIVITYYLPFFRTLNITTAYEYLEKRFNIAVRMFGSLSFVLFQLARMGIVVYLPALALSTVIGMDIYMAIIIMGVLATVYTYMGGIEAVIWTDVVQVVVLIGGLILSIIYILLEVGDVGHIINTAVENDKLQMFDFRWSTTEVVTWSLFLGSFALNIIPYTTDQAVVQRYLTTSSEKEARKSIWLNGLISIPVGLLIFGLGTFLFVFFKDNPDFIAVGMQNDGIFPLFIANHLPPGVSGLVIAGIYSASMSSLDSSMHSISTVATVDFYERFSDTYSEERALKIAKFTILVVGGIGTAVACLMAAFPIASLFFFFQEVVGLFGSALAGIFILGIFFKKSNWAGALIGAVLSVLVLVVIKSSTHLNFYIYPLIAIPVCVIGGYMASLVIPVQQKNVEHLVYSKKRLKK